MGEKGEGRRKNPFSHGVHAVEKIWRFGDS
jgi:hypothetical protein